MLTTASVSIIDKRAGEGWEYFEIDTSGKATPLPQPSGTRSKVLPYSRRGDELHALRGLSPGGQDIFVLTEEERLHFSLQVRRDVVPCVTTLRYLTSDVQTLDGNAFADEYVAKGKRCWLIRTDRSSISTQLQLYLDSVGEHWKRYTTCTSRKVWWEYKPHPAPALLFSSGFVGRSSKVVVNTAGAVAVGAVYGIISACKERPYLSKLARRLRTYDFRRRVVSHANNLHKVEVNQLNAALSELA